MKGVRVILGTVIIGLAIFPSSAWPGAPEHVRRRALRVPGRGCGGCRAGPLSVRARPAPGPKVDLHVEDLACATDRSGADL
jgi:hypothetical protein